MHNLTAKELSCARGYNTIYHGVSFTLKAGEVLLLTGANGSGKTTLLRNISGLLPLCEGEVLWDQKPAQDLNHNILFLSQDLPLKAELTLSENLAFLHDALNISTKTSASDLLALYGLQDLGDYPAYMLSSGQKRRLLMTLLESDARPLWLLDEPTTHLDAEGIKLLLAKIKSHQDRGGLAIIATHQPEVFGDSTLLNIESHILKQNA
tara:strand:- start:232 stop:855 length:624 start_codon:yes stop_codon:yes gene_type:complete